MLVWASFLFHQLIYCIVYADIILFVKSTFVYNMIIQLMNLKNPLYGLIFVKISKK